MNTIIEDVFSLSKDFMRNAIHVEIIPDKIKEISKRIGVGIVGNPIFNEQVLRENVLFEFIVNSINYCFWYGKSNIRPGRSSSETLYEIVGVIKNKINNSTIDIDDIREVIRLLAFHRFPLLEERKRHLLEVFEYYHEFVYNVIGRIKKTTDPGYEEEVLTDLFQYLATSFPGYGSDMFFKRVSLFFISLHRQLYLFPNTISMLPVPADYQVPKVLRAYGCIKYSDELENKVKNEIIIQKNSAEECEIRSATILVCRKFREYNPNLSISDIDWWLWSQRKKFKEPFHLTVTTDY